MSLPRTRNQGYNPGVTKVASADMNGVQDGVVNSYWRRKLVRDDFMGDSLDRGQWINVVTLGSGAATLVDDSANGGSGVYKLDTGAGVGKVSLGTRAYALATSDFLFRVRARTTGVTVNSNFMIGVGSNFGFTVVNAVSTTNWGIMLPVGGYTTPSIAVPVSTSYKLFDVERISGTTYFYVDNVLVYQTNTSFNITGNAVAAIAGDNVLASAGILWLDAVEAYAYYI